ncbi:hypothetical protein GCM10010310_24920 [Streptomyces violaceolatus]|uniref:Uncharacterized protein n=1 Tax=Streptomyces violaceolatus TaxID=67378 RepID=A0ABN3SJU6_9ACTN|nr:hypothetical protein JCM4020_76420 [Streptomyces coelicolor]
MRSAHTALTGPSGRGARVEEESSTAVATRPTAAVTAHAATHLRRLVRNGSDIRASYVHAARPRSAALSRTAGGCPRID